MKRDGTWFHVIFFNQNIVNTFVNFLHKIGVVKVISINKYTVSVVGY